MAPRLGLHKLQPWNPPWLAHHCLALSAFCGTDIVGRTDELSQAIEMADTSIYLTKRYLLETPS